MTIYGERDDKIRPVFQIAMPRLPRIYALGGTMPVVARCKNREFYFAAPEDFEILLDHLGEMSSAYAGIFGKGDIGLAWLKMTYRPLRRLGIGIEIRCEPAW